MLARIGLPNLVDQSLLQVESEADREPRFRMLESIREYAWERLVGSADFAAIRTWRAAVFLSLAQSAESELRDFSARCERSSWIALVTGRWPAGGTTPGRSVLWLFCTRRTGMDAKPPANQSGPSPIAT
jgi:hypothetical protein